MLDAMQRQVRTLVDLGWTYEGAVLLATKMAEDSNTVYDIEGLKRRLFGTPRRRPGRRVVRRKASIPTDLRWQVWERDNFTCRICGTRRRLSVDHIVPESRGGTLALDNLQTLCVSCNSKKGVR